MAAAIQTEVLLPGEEVDVPIEQQFSGGDKTIPESPFILAACKDDDISHVVTSSTYNMVQMIMDSSEQQEQDINSDIQDINTDDVQDEEWNDVGKQVLSKHRKDFSFGITAARQMSGDIMYSSSELPQEIGIQNMLTSRQSNNRKLSPPDMLIDLERTTSATEEPPSIPQSSQGIVSSLRTLTPTPPPTPDTSSASDKPQPSHSRKASINAGGQLSLEQLAEEQDPSQDALGKLLPGLSTTMSGHFCPPRIQEHEQESSNSLVSLQSLINSCKKAGNDLVMELCNHPSSSEVVLNAKSDLQDVCMRLIQSLGLTETIVKLEQQNNQQEQKQQQNASWQVEFWKVKYKEAAEKYNKLSMYYQKQQQQQQQQQKQQQQQQGSGGISPFAQPWKSQQSLSRQSSIASMNAYKPTVMTPLVRTPSGTQQQPQLKDNLRTSINDNSGGNSNVAIPPDSAILSVNGVVTGPSEILQKTNIVRNETPRPDILRKQKGDYQERRGAQDQRTQQRAKNGGQSNKSNRGRRGKSSSNKNKNKDQQQQQQNLSQNVQTQDGRYTSTTNDNNIDNDERVKRGPRDSHRGGGGGRRGFTSSRNARRGGRSGAIVTNDLQRQNNDRNISELPESIKLNEDADTRQNNILASIAQVSAQNLSSSD
eukprot:TRINITY_DN3110_c0_g1_i2.p1 TRINITY_DN3110_c0_g1~~TRINITY_DN3110_c0_g1_i2.p1  ORF type:complete len:650 (+),score=84.32 TRINITY_DN3110_c0_g1_i2:197-2146(+)